MATNSNPRNTESKPSAAPLSARDKLLKKAGTAAPKPAAGKKKNRGAIIVGDTPETRIVGDAVDRLTAAVHVKKSVEGHEKAARAVVLPYVKRETLRLWVQQGGKAENPQVSTPTGSHFIMQVKDTLTGLRGFRVPKDETGQPIDVEQHLQNHGVSQELIERLKEAGEFVDQEVMTIPMARLEKENRDLADRLINLIVAANDGGVSTKDGKKIKFSDDEMGKLVEVAHDVTIKEGFLDRVVQHCATISREEDAQLELLDSILTAIPPQWAVGSVNPGLKEDVMVKTLLHSDPPEPAEAPAPKVPPKPVDHDAASYTLRVEGLKITVIRKKDDKELATKVCKDSGHVANTVKKWQREPDTLNAFITENL